MPVLVPVPLDTPFDYALDDDRPLRPGDYVEVPFGPRQLIGVVWDEAAERPAAPARLKPAGRRLEAPPTPGRARKLAALGAKVFPGADPNDFSEWMGHRPGTPDSLPVIGALRRHPAIYCAFGHGQTGLTGAASTGELIAAIIGERKPPIDVAPFSPRRFGA